MIEKLKTQIDKSLITFLESVKRDYSFRLVDPLLYESIKEFCLRPGKRVRPILLILCYQGYSKKNRKPHPSLFNAAICIELLHNFMLIHDDIIDRSNLRRGKPTLHKLLRKAAKTKDQDKLGYDLAIVAGDIVYALAIDSFLSINEQPYRKEKALKHFVQTAAFTAMGEFMDTLNGVKRISDVTQKDVLLNYTLKTAKYTFECPLVIGAILAGAPQKDIKMISEIGIKIGQAFQIQDDILGIFDSQKNIGKSILSDLVEAKKTILVYHAYENLNPHKKRMFLKHFNKPKKNYSDLVAIRKIFIESGSLSYSLQEIEKRLSQAEKIIAKLKIKPTYRDLIKTSLLSFFKHSRHIANQYLANT